MDQKQGAAMVKAILGGDGAEKERAEVNMAGAVLVQVLDEKERYRWARNEEPPARSEAQINERSRRRAVNHGLLETLCWAVHTMGRRYPDDERIQSKLGRVRDWMHREWRCGALPRDCVFARHEWARGVVAQ